MVILIVVGCSIVVLGVLVGLQQVVTYQAQIALEKYNEYQKQQTADSPTKLNPITTQPTPTPEPKPVRLTPSPTPPTTESKPITTPVQVPTPAVPPISKSTSKSSQNCLGNARCINGTVTKIIDGDTIKVDGQSIRFALASAPELSESGGTEARDFIDILCPVGSTALVDEDDGQTEGIYERIIGVIYCNGKNLNEELVESSNGYLSSMFCSKSEFSNDTWAQKYGC